MFGTSTGLLDLNKLVMELAQAMTQIGYEVSHTMKTNSSMLQYVTQGGVFLVKGADFVHYLQSITHCVWSDVIAVLKNALSRCK